MKSIRMTYDPYQQELSFQYNGGELDNHSPLRDFTKEKRALRTSLQDVFTVIERQYGVDSDGVEVEFCGTQDDYDAVRVFLDRQAADQIKLLPFKRKMIAGKDAESLVSEAYKKIRPKFSVDQEEEASDVIRQISDAVEKYNDVTRPELNLVVVGIYSSGSAWALWLGTAEGAGCAGG